MGKVTMAGTGGGADLDAITAAANDVLAGKVIVGPDGEPLTGTLALTGTAADSQVLSGKTYYNTDAKTKRTGTMLTMGGQTITPGAAQQTVSCAGRYMTGNIVVAGDRNLTAGNILNGVNIFGVTGNVRKYAFKSGTISTSGGKNFTVWNFGNASKYYRYLEIPTGFTPLTAAFRCIEGSNPSFEYNTFLESGQFVTDYNGYNGMINSSGGAQYDSTKMLVPVPALGTYTYYIAGYY